MSTQVLNAVSGTEHLSEEQKQEVLKVKDKEVLRPTSIDLKLSCPGKLRKKSSEKISRVQYAGLAVAVLPHRVDPERPAGGAAADALSGSLLQQLDGHEGGGAGHVLADNSRVLKGSQ